MNLLNEFLSKVQYSPLNRSKDHNVFFPVVLMKDKWASSSLSQRRWFSFSLYSCFWALFPLSGVLAKWMLCLQHVLVLSSGVCVCARTHTSLCLVQSCYLGSSFLGSVCVRRACRDSFKEQLGFQRLCMCVCAFVCQT